MNPIHNTPPFLIWSIQQQCTLRDEIADEAGFGVIRHLRPLRAYSDSLENGRIFEGVCVQLPPESIDDPTSRHKGFVAEETLDFYGGHELIAGQCGNCPANAAAKFFDRSFAGCNGMLQTDVTNPGLPELFATAIQQADLSQRVAETFARTSHPWHALWIESPIGNGVAEHPPEDQTGKEKLAVLNQTCEVVFAGAIEHQSFVSDRSRREFAEFHEAVRRAQSESLKLNVELVPGGQTTTEKDWIVVPHCYRCKAEMQEDQRKCDVCKRPGGPHPKLRRRARGDRPYWSLSGFLGESGAEQFLQRYRRAGRVE